MLALTSFSFSPLQENTYVLYNADREACIIDPGCYFPEEKKRLQDFVEQEALKPTLLLNTHCHIDHVFGNQFVFDTWGLIPHFHEKETPVLDLLPLSAQLWNLKFDIYAGEVAHIREGETIWLGNEELSILFTPGHSPGSVSFYHEAGKFIIGGDVLFRGSIGRTDLPGGDYDTLIDSINREFMTLPPDTTVYSGHGDPSTVAAEKATNPFLND